ITVTLGSTLDLDGGDSISGGLLSNSGELDATSTVALGANALHGVGITNASGGIIESTGGLVTIDGCSTIGNAGTLPANGGELDITNVTVTSNNALKAINNSVLELTSTTVTNTNGAANGTITVTLGSTLDLDGGDSISGGLISTAAALDSTRSLHDALPILHGVGITNASGGIIESTG